MTGAIYNLQKEVRIKEAEATLEKEELKSTIQRLETEINVNTLKLENVAMKQQMTQPRHDEVATQIAFSVASHESFGPASPDDVNIPYEIVYTDVGDGWDPLLDAFHAPVAGVYQFIASSYGDSNSNTYCHIVHSTQTTQTKVASLYGNYRSNGFSADANSVIIALEEGDYVSVQLQSGGGELFSSSSYVFSTFSGFLLF